MYDALLVPTTLKELDELCEKLGFTWELDNYGGIVIYTGLRPGPKNLEPYIGEKEPECGD